MFRSRLRVYQFAVVLSIAYSALAVASAETPERSSKPSMPSGDWSVEGVGFPMLTSGDQGVLDGSAIVGFSVFGQPRPSSPAGSIAIHSIGTTGAQVVECDLMRDAGMASLFRSGKDCELQGLFSLEPLLETCQAILRFLPDSGDRGDEPVTVGLVNMRLETCPKLHLDLPRGFESVDLHSAIATNGVLIEYWRGADVGGGSLAQLHLTAPDGNSVTIVAKTIWQVGTAGQSMEFLSPEDIADVNDDGIPDIVLGSWHGGNCCRSFYLFGLGADPQVLAFSSAAIDRLGWELIDLDGDGVSELVAGGRNLFDLGCPTGIDDPLAVASYHPDLGTYLVDSRDWLPTYGHFEGIADLIGSAVTERPPREATEQEELHFACEVTAAVLPALAVGLISSEEVRNLVGNPKMGGTFDDEFAEAIIDYIDSYPGGFDVRVTPWQRIITPEQLFLLPCPAIGYAIDLIAAGSRDQEAGGRGKAFAHVNTRILEAYFDRIECDGPALASFSTRLGNEPELCLGLGAQESTCRQLEITASWVLLEAIYDATVILHLESAKATKIQRPLHDMVTTLVDVCMPGVDYCFGWAVRQAAEELIQNEADFLIPAEDM